MLDISLQATVIERTTRFWLSNENIQCGNVIVFFKLKPLLSYSKVTAQSVSETNVSLLNTFKKDLKANQPCPIAPGSLFETGSRPWIGRRHERRSTSPAGLLTSMMEQRWGWLLKGKQLKVLNLSIGAAGNGQLLHLPLGLHLLFCHLPNTSKLSFSYKALIIFKLRLWNLELNTNGRVSGQLSSALTWPYGALQYLFRDPEAEKRDTGTWIVSDRGLGCASKGTLCCFGSWWHPGMTGSELFKPVGVPGLYLGTSFKLLLSY